MSLGMTPTAAFESILPTSKILHITVTCTELLITVRTQEERPPISGIKIHYKTPSLVQGCFEAI
eukprot:c36835_g1_i1 orf=62-253(+)